MKTRWVGILFLPIVAIAILVSGPSAAQSPPEWRDTLIDHMAGTWKLEGQVMGRDAHHDVKADWVLRHQFLRIHEKTSADAPKSEEAYEAIWFLGYDPVSERYLLHLMDVLERDSRKRQVTEAATATSFISCSNTLTGRFILHIVGIPKRTPGNG